MAAKTKAKTSADKSAERVRDDLRPALFSFCRGMYFSDGMFYGAASKDPSQALVPIQLEERSFRGQHGSFSMQSAYERPDGFQAGNPQRADTCALPVTCDTLVCDFSVTVYGQTRSPHQCNSQLFQELTQRFHTAYDQRGGFDELGARYLDQFLSGGWFWRNQTFSRRTSVTLKMLSGEDEIVLSTEDDSQRAVFHERFVDALAGRAHCFIEVTGSVLMYPGMPVFPSQEMKMKSRQGDKTRVLFCKHDQFPNHTGLHSQKIGNHIRQIDDWYDAPEGTRNVGPIAVEPYGIKMDICTAYRPMKGGSVYDHLLRYPAFVEELESADEPSKDHHYVMACFLRGAVLGLQNNKS